MMDSKKQPIDWITKAKGFAILGVVAVHTIQRFTVSKWVTEIFGAGMYCVSLFFIISAFLSFKSFDEKQQINSAKSYFKYLGHKIVRLIPVLYIALLWNTINYSFAIGHVPDLEDVVWKKVLYSAFFVNGFSYQYFNSWMTWYIGVLVIFIAIAPLLYRLINTLKKPLFFLQ